MRAVLACAIALAGCITSDLVPCGSVSCPVGSMCVGGNVCATQDQLDACVSRAEGDRCLSSVGAGTCHNGVCLVDRCGDGIVDPGEVCDDGNLMSGDGCREDCLSNETCGNGLRDQGEGCDCGTVDNLAVGCTGPNSDDLTATCDTACTRRCGDGFITGLEQCDGTTIGATCRDLGYYTGAPACTSFCGLDSSGCSGKCGDSIVQADEGEDCDGNHPNYVCTSFGRDYGALGCSKFCAPDIPGSCFRYGWTLVLTASGAIQAAAANDKGAIAISGASTVASVWNGVVDSRANPGWTRAAASPAWLVAAGTSSYGWFDGTWHDVTLALPAGNLAMGTTGLYIVNTDCTAVVLDVTAGTLASLPTAPATTCASAVVVQGDLFVSGNTAGVLRFNGTTWSTEWMGIANAVEGARPGHVVFRGSGTNWSDLDITVASPTPAPLSLHTPTTRFVEDSDGNLVVIDNGLEGPVVESGPVRGEQTANMTDQVREIGRTPDGAALVYYKQIYRLDPLPVPVDAVSTQNVKQLHVLSDGALAYCGLTVGTVDRDITTNTNGNNCAHLVGDPRHEHLVATASGIFHFADGGTGYAQETGSGSVSGLAGDVAGAFAIVNASILHRQGSSSWLAVATPSGCTEAKQFAYVAPDMYALFNCSPFPRVARWDGTAFVFIPTNSQPITDLIAASDGTLLVSDLDGTYTMAGSTLTKIGPQLHLLAATSGTDVYGLTAATPSKMAHLVAGYAEEVNLPSNVIALTPNEIFVWSDATNQIQGIPRMPLRLPAHGL